jgi:hypothetical protein
MTAPKKECHGCFQKLPPTAFYWDKRFTPWRRRSRCIACMCLAQAGHNSKREVERKVYKRQRRASGKVG